MNPNGIIPNICREIAEMLRQANLKAKQAAEETAKNQALQSGREIYADIAAIVYEVIIQNANSLELLSPGSMLQIMRPRGVKVSPHGKVFYIVIVQKTRQHRLSRQEFGGMLQNAMDTYCYFHGYSRIRLARIAAYNSTQLALAFTL